MNDLRDDDDRLVAFLRQFQPRPSGPLRGEGLPRARFWLGVAAAGLLGVMGTTLWLSNRLDTSPAPAPTVADREGAPAERSYATVLRLGQVARMVEWDAARLDQLLTDLSPDLLPRVEQPESTLSVLAKP
jgi:hypothetical protein